MRIYDIITPKELDKLYTQYYNEMESLGQRVDLQTKKIAELAHRIDAEYTRILVMHHFLTPDAAIGAHRLLALLDRFLEEKYVNTKHAD